MGDLISVIIPVYNGEKYISKCLKSLLVQTYSNFEVIVIDDGSKDNSLSILKVFSKKDTRIKIISQENSGVSSSRNRGILAAKGKYITFVDIDDYVSSDYLLNLKNNMHDSIQIVISNAVDVDSNGKILHDKKLIREEKTLTSEQIMKEIFLEINTFGTCWGNLYLTEICKENLFNTNFSICEDLLFLNNYLSNIENGIIINDNIYYYVTHSSSTVHQNFNTNREDEFKACLELIDKYKDTRLEKFAKYRYIRCLVDVLLYFNPTKEKKRYIKKELKRLILVGLKSNNYPLKRKVKLILALFK